MHSVLIKQINANTAANKHGSLRTVLGQTCTHADALMGIKFVTS